MTLEPPFDSKIPRRHFWSCISLQVFAELLLAIPNLKLISLIGEGLCLAVIYFHVPCTYECVFLCVGTNI